MADFQTPSPAAGGAWSAAPSRPAGLYGELPPLPVDRPSFALARKPRHRIQSAD